ncbi:MAG: M14 family zinc carboxypeptidase [Luteimonas sp.]
MLQGPPLPLLLCALFLVSACSTDAPAQTPSIAQASGATAATTEVPAPPSWLGELEAQYGAELLVAGLEERTFSAEHWWQVAMPLLGKDAGFSVEQVGQSAQGRPLRHVQWGEGKTAVLLWSQMHGDESTASMALVDLFHLLGTHRDHPLVARLHEQTTLHFLPVMNPDGAARFQRRNAHGIDINRDARALATPEGRALKALRDRIEPEFGFNLHDQRPGYRAGDSDRGVAIALLAPPFDESRGVNAVRGRAMHVAAVIRAALEPHIAGHMARWDDTFNPRAFGDLMTTWGTSTILIESGGIEGDPEKQAVRRLNFIALAAALDAIAEDTYADMPQSLYTDLPENGRVAPDLLIRGATLATPGTAPARADVLVNFQHALAERGGRITDIGDLAESRPRHVVDATGLYIVPIDGADGARGDIATGSPARFHLSRDAEGRDIVWTLDEDIDPQHPRPPSRP